MKIELREGKYEVMELVYGCENGGGKEKIWSNRAGINL